MPFRATSLSASTLALALAAFTLTSCSAPATGTSGEPAPSMSEVQETAAADAAAAPAAEPESTLNKLPKFGETVTFDGLSVGVSAPEAFSPSQYAFGADQAANVKFTVTLTNTGSEGYDPVLTFISASSGQQEATQIFDEALMGAPTTTILPGQAVSYQVGFSVADPAQIVLDVTGGFDYETVTYTS